MSKQTKWLIVSLISAVAAVCLVLVAAAIDDPFASFVLFLGTAVFLIVLYYNPDNRFWHLAVYLVSTWLAIRKTSLALGPGWGFDLVVGFLAIFLIAVDYVQRQENSGLKHLRALFSFRWHWASQRSAGGNPQQIQIGDVISPNAVINITQQQGLGAKEVVDLVAAQVSDLTAEIDLAAESTVKGQPDVTIRLLKDLRKGKWERLSPRERWRLLVNLGRAWERKGDKLEAARLYLEAKPYFPDDERARSFEAIAYSYLGERSKAHGLAASTLADFPTSSLSAAVWVRSAPDATPYSEIEAKLPAAVKDHVEVLHALLIVAQPA